MFWTASLAELYYRTPSRTSFWQKS